MLDVSYEKESGVDERTFSTQDPGKALLITAENSSPDGQQSRIDIKQLTSSDIYITANYHGFPLLHNYIFLIKSSRIISLPLEQGNNASEISLLPNANENFSYQYGIHGNDSRGACHL